MNKINEPEGIITNEGAPEQAGEEREEMEEPFLEEYIEDKSISYEEYEGEEELEELEREEGIEAAEEEWKWAKEEWEEEVEGEEEERRDIWGDDFHFMYEGTARDTSYFANSILDKIGQRAITNSAPICNYYERLILMKRIIILDDLPDKIKIPTAVLNKTSDRLCNVRHNWKKEREAQLQEIENKFKVSEAALKAVASPRLQALALQHAWKARIPVKQPPQPVVKPAALKFIASERIRELAKPKRAFTAVKYEPPPWVPRPMTPVEAYKLSPRIENLAKPVKPRQKYVRPPLAPSPTVKPEALSFQATERIMELCQPTRVTPKYKPPIPKPYVRLSTKKIVYSARLAELSKPKKSFKK